MRKKTAFMFGVFITLFLVLSLSLFRWQILEGAQWNAIAQSSRKFSSTIQTQRGIILDRNGNILASNEIVYNIFIIKSNITSTDAKTGVTNYDKNKMLQFSNQLSTLFQTSSDQYLSLMNDDSVTYFQIGKKISQDLKDKAVQLDCETNLPVKFRENSSGKIIWNCDNIQKAESNLYGIHIDQGSKRIYPNGSLASHVVGFVGLDSNGNEIGSNGVEGYYDQYLVGKSGIIEGTRDQSGNFILRDDLKTNTGEDGTYLDLTLDTGIQKIVEEKLKAQVEAQNAKGGTVVVMDPLNGDILAFANYPNYDPSKYYNGEIIDCTKPRYKNYKTCEDTNPNKDTNTEWLSLSQDQKNLVLQNEKNIPGVFTNPGLADVAEPGSISKLITVSAAINEGKVNAQTKIPDHAGCVMVADRKICTSNFVGAKDQTVEKMIEISDNIGAMYVGATMGADTLYKYLSAFGIGKEARVGLDGESVFPLETPDQWNIVDKSTASFGQGVVSTNSMENISAIATIANGGKRVQPHIIKKFVSKEKEKDFVAQVVSTPITKSTADQVVAIMEQSTKEGYTAPPLRDVLPYYSVAGKTGTAQIPDGKGGYIPHSYNNTYIAFAPVHSPKIIMLVTIRQPQHGTYAGFSAVPVWNDIAKEVLPYMGVIPDKVKN